MKQKLRTPVTFSVMIYLPFDHLCKGLARNLVLEEDPLEDPGLAEIISPGFGYNSSEMFLYNLMD